jgi:hypothetical protein
MISFSPLAVDLPEPHPLKESSAGTISAASQNEKPKR